MVSCIIFYVARFLPPSVPPIGGGIESGSGIYVAEARAFSHAYGRHMSHLRDVSKSDRIFADEAFPGFRREGNNLCFFVGSHPVDEMALGFIG